MFEYGDGTHPTNSNEAEVFHSDVKKASLAGAVIQECAWNAEEAYQVLQELDHYLRPLNVSSIELQDLDGVDHAYVLNVIDTLLESIT